MLPAQEIERIAALAEIAELIADLSIDTDTPVDEIIPLLSALAKKKGGK